MKPKNLLLAAALLSSPSHAATIIQTVGNLDWNAAVWGPGPSTPTTGNDYVTAPGVASGLVRISASGGASTFGGDNLTVVAGSRALMKNLDATATLTGSLTLNGGRLSFAPNNVAGATLTLTQFVVTGTGSLIDLSDRAQRLLINGALTGNGDLVLDYEQSANATAGQTLAFASVGNYTGTIHDTNNIKIDFDSATVFLGTLDLRPGLEAGDPGGILNVDQILTFNSGALIANSGAVPVGTYTGASLDALGTQFVNGGGTVIVVPEPAGALLLGLGSFFSVLLRRKRQGACRSR